VQHLRDKLDELTLGMLLMLLQRNPDSRLSLADLRFLGPVESLPLVKATLPVPPLAGLRDAGDEWTEWLGAVGQGGLVSAPLRAEGWHPLNHTPLLDDAALGLLQVAKRPNGRERIACVFVSVCDAPLDAASAWRRASSAARFRDFSWPRQLLARATSTGEVTDAHPQKSAIELKLWAEHDGGSGGATCFGGTFGGGGGGGGSTGEGTSAIDHWAMRLEALCLHLVACAAEQQLLALPPLLLPAPRAAMQRVLCAFCDAHVLGCTTVQHASLQLAMPAWALPQLASHVHAYVARTSAPAMQPLFAHAAAAAPEWREEHAARGLEPDTAEAHGQSFAVLSGLSGGGDARERRLLVTLEEDRVVLSECIGTSGQDTRSRAQAPKLAEPLAAAFLSLSRLSLGEEAPATPSVSEPPPPPVPAPAPGNEMLLDFGRRFGPTREPSASEAAASARRSDAAAVADAASREFDELMVALLVAPLLHSWQHVVAPESGAPPPFEPAAFLDAAAQWLAGGATCLSQLHGDDRAPGDGPSAASAAKAHLLLLRQGGFLVCLHLGADSSSVKCRIHLIGRAPAAAETDRAALDRDVAQIVEGLSAFYFDFVVGLCLPSDAAPAHPAATHLDTLSIARLLQRQMPQPPPGARCKLLPGDLLAPVAGPLPLLQEYVQYLVKRRQPLTTSISAVSRVQPDVSRVQSDSAECSSSAAAALATSAVAAVVAAAAAVDTAAVHAAGTFEPKSEVRLVACGADGLSFRLPPPHDAHACLAWPVVDGPAAARTDDDGAESIPHASELGGVPRWLLIQCSVEAAAEDEQPADFAGRQLLSDMLSQHWTAFLQAHMWRRLKRGERPPLEEVLEFLQRLPTSYPLEQILPSLRDIRRLELAWQGLIAHLEALPFTSSRWTSTDREHLLLLDNEDADDDVYSGGRVTHVSVSAGGDALRVRACCTNAISQQQLLTQINTKIAGEITSWLWEHMAGPLTMKHFA
jgi:hypothetical protein